MRHEISAFIGRLTRLFIPDSERTCECESRFQKIFEEGPFGVVIAGPDARFITANPAFCRMIGYSLEELASRSFAEITHPDDVPKDAENVARLKEGKIPVYRTEKKYLTKKGDEIWGDLTLSGIRDERGKLICFLGTIQDVTERRKADRDLRESEELYRTALESSNDGVSILQGGKYLYANQKFLNTFGITLEEFYRTAHGSMTHPDDRERIREYYRRLERGEPTPTHFEFRGIRKDGSTIYLEASASLISYYGQRAQLAFLRDVTERKRMEEEKRELTQRLHQAEKVEAIGTLAGGIAHEFNNILAAIMGSAELIKLKLGERELADYPDHIVNSCLRASDLVKQILIFSRQQEDKEAKVVDLGLLAADALKLLRASIPKNVMIDLRLAPRMDAVLADSTEIYQIIMNLCANASQAMDDRGGRIEICFQNTEMTRQGKDVPELKPGHYVELTVSDTGAGIDPEIIGRIFDPFFTTKERGKGTGLGLSVVYGIVKKYEGAVRVRSKPGEGSAFSIYLPAFRGNPDAPRKKEDPAPAGSVRILLVDDEEALVRTGHEILEHLGYQVTSADDSLKALQLFRSAPGRYDLVITDMAMPGLTGTALAREILLIRPDIPVIICTGYSDFLTEEALKEHGIRSILPKPFTLDRLAREVRSALEPKRTA